MEISFSVAKMNVQMIFIRIYLLMKTIFYLHIAKRTKVFEYHENDIHYKGIQNKSITVHGPSKTKLQKLGLLELNKHITVS